MFAMTHVKAPLGVATNRILIATELAPWAGPRSAQCLAGITAVRFARHHASIFRVYLDRITAYLRILSVRKTPFDNSKHTWCIKAPITDRDAAMHVRAYLRASTKEQDAHRAMTDLEAFCRERDLTIAATYPENESGASLKRPELFRLLSDCKPGDILLIEQVDRLSRLTTEDWEKLKREIKDREVKVVALDLPTSHAMVRNEDLFTGRVFAAVNEMMLDVLAAVARKDYDDRRRRQAQGIATAKAARKYRGRPEEQGAKRHRHGAAARR